MIKKLIGIVTITMMMFGLTACRADIDGKYKGFSNGFNYYIGKIPTIMCAVRSDKIEFDVNDVTLDFYFGWYENLPFGYIDPDNYDSVCAALYFSNDYPWRGTVDDYRNVENNYFIREILYGEVFSGDFIVNMTRISGKSFGHKESLTVPKELFGAEKGFVYFGMIKLSFSNSKNTYYSQDGGDARFWYEYINDNTVRISKS